MNTIERLIPDEVAENDTTGQKTLELHLARYRFAARHLRPGRLLDAACGVGYGTRLLADESDGITEALGIDISLETIQYAEKRFGASKVRFQQHDAMTFNDPSGFDSITSIETVEHVIDPAALIRHLAGLLLPQGVLIASVPTTLSTDVNPYHLHDFTEGSFRKMVGTHGLIEIATFRQIQPYSVLKMLRLVELRMDDMRKNLAKYYANHPRMFVKRLWTTLRYGFTNRYVTIVSEKVS